MTSTRNISFNRILIITSEFPPGPGGIGNHAYNLAKNLQNIKEVEVTVLADTYFTTHKELKEFDSSNNFKIYRIYRARIILLTYLKRIFLARKLIAENDKIVCSGKFPLWLGGLYKLFFPKKEFIAVAHGSELDLKNELARKFTMFSINKIDKIISVSSYTESHLPDLKNGQERTIIANGIDLSEIKNNTDQSFKNENNGVLHLLTVGNVTPRKGQKNVIRALPQIKKYFPGVHYDIVGLSTHKESLCDFARELNVLDHITFHGKVERGKLLYMYNKCDVFMMLSDHTADGDFEGFGIAVLEANMWKKPAVGSRKSGIADAIDDGITGVLVDQHNVDEIAEAIVKIKNDYESYCQHAYEWAIKHDWKKIAEKYHNFIFN